MRRKVEKENSNKKMQDFLKHILKKLCFFTGVQHQSSFWLSCYKTRNNLSPESIQPKCIKFVEIPEKNYFHPTSKYMLSAVVEKIKSDYDSLHNDTPSTMLVETAVFRG